MARVRVSTNVITVLNLLYILTAVGLGNDATTTLYFICPCFQAPRCPWIIVAEIWASPCSALAILNMWHRGWPQLRSPLSQCFIKVFQTSLPALHSSDDVSRTREYIQKLCANCFTAILGQSDSCSFCCNLSDFILELLT